jgi:small subunit ribosomal protein S14
VAKKSLIAKSQNIPKFGVRAYNRCKICGRAHGYMRKFDICRICFRSMSNRGEVTGVTKSSW